MVAVGLGIESITEIPVGVDEATGGGPDDGADDEPFGRHQAVGVGHGHPHDQPE